MRKKKQLLIMLCAFSMLRNGAEVVAQSEDKNQAPKMATQQEPGSPNAVFPIGEPPLMGPSFHIAVAPPGQDGAAHHIEFIHNEFTFDGKVVKDAPYSADAVTETMQTLGDGNRIVRNSSARVFRDSAGRTRREQVINVGSGEAPLMIFINDPITGIGYNLDSRAKIAHKMMAPPPPPELSKQNGAELKTKSTSSLIVRTVTGAEAGVVSIGAPGVPMPMEGGIIALSDGPEVNQESLGTQTIEGVAAEGTRVTFTIPAGKIGNERPIITVNERWYSPELQTVVLSKTNDPRMGETTYRLTNIVRSEPDPALFQVPAGYKVEENGFGFGIKTRPHAPPRTTR
jgi:hypothetical protein